MNNISSTNLHFFRKYSFEKNHLLVISMVVMNPSIYVIIVSYNQNPLTAKISKFLRQERKELNNKNILCELCANFVNFAVK
jgi:TRAP-type C4-dicarboxylate transport system substrate-binding protein